jgi:hypothetical protein
MPDSERFHHPWLVAVWPGMGQVAINAGNPGLSQSLTRSRHRASIAPSEPAVPHLQDAPLS